MSFYIKRYRDNVVILRLPNCEIYYTKDKADLREGYQDKWLPFLPKDWKIDSVSAPSVNINRTSQQLYIIATGECNLECKYCSQSKGNERNMSKSLMLNSVKEYLEKCRDPKGIIFYGGEPLLNWNSIESTIEYIRNKNQDIEISIFTNGSLITDNIAKFLSKHNIGVIVSIDGDKESHDQIRLYRNSLKGSYENCVSGFLRSKEFGCTTGISCVIGPHNFYKIEAVTEHLCRLNPVNIGMNIMHAPKRSGFYFSEKDGAYSIIKAAKVAADFNIEIEQFSRRLKSFINEKPRLGDCPACGSRIVITPLGKYGPCEGAYPFLRDWFFDSENEIRELSRKLNNWVITDNEKCKTCEAKGICGKGCVLDAFLVENNFCSRDVRTCELSLEILHFALDYINASNPKNDEIISKEMKEVIFSQFVTKKNMPLRSSSNFGENYS